MIDETVELAAAAGSRRGVPAWAMSVSLHLVCVVLLALFWQAGPVRGGAGETARRAGIVVAVQSDGATEYFDQQDASDAASPTAAASSGGAAQAADPLPQMSQTADLPAIDLPGAVSGTVSGDLLQGPDLGLSGSRNLPSADDGALGRILSQEAANRPPPPVGVQAPLTVFGAPSVGRSFVFVIDRSKSMGSSGLGAISAARKELAKGLATLTPKQRFEVVAYHQSPVTFAEKYEGRKGLLPVNDKNLRRVQEFFSGLAAFGATQHVYALHLAMDLRPEVIYFLTDGGDPYPSPAQMRDLNQRAKRLGIAIHCVQFGFGPLQETDNFMMRLSHENNGSFRYINMSAAKNF